MKYDLIFEGGSGFIEKHSNTISGLFGMDFHHLDK